MDLYDQDSETLLLGRLMRHLDSRSLIAVGVEGIPAELRTGAEEVHTFGPRPLGPLVDAGEIPSHAGILRIHAKHANLDVVRGIGDLQPDVVVIEHWADVPGGLGKCPWIVDDLLAELGPRGLSHFAFLVDHGEFVFVKWDDGRAELGAIGCLVFLHQDVLDQLLPEVLDCAGVLAERAVRIGQAYMRAWNDRTALVAELTKAADERLALIHELEQRAAGLERTTGERLELINVLQRTAEERLELINKLAESA